MAFTRNNSPFAYRIGAEMFRQGKDIHANPYKPGTHSWEAWRRGWNSEAVK